MKLFSNFSLKVMAIIFMVMDHMYTYLNITGLEIPICFGYLGKISAPIFFYLIVEGFFHTRSRVKYMSRLFLMGALMIGLDLVLGIHNNIFLSLGLGVSLMSTIEYIKMKEKGSNDFICGIAFSAIIIILAIFTEASYYGVGMILIFYFLREKKLLMILAYTVFSLIGLVGVTGPDFYEAAFKWDYQWMMVFSIIPILLYNGKKGLSNKLIKWMFYWFYPIHLIIIVSMAKLIAM